MRALLRVVLGIACAICAGYAAWAQQTGGARAERRVALVIGNASYRAVPHLPNPRNDAGDVSASLRRLGFEVIEGPDLDKRGMDRKLAEFARAAQSADAALVFYAGHGLQHGGQNYLVPTDAKLEDEIDLDYETIPLDDVMRALDRAGGARILILDACRNLPLAGRPGRAEAFAGQGSTQNLTQGLARVAGRKGLIVAYATQPNDVAYDGAGRNSFFTAALLRELDEPGLEVGQVFQRVSASVAQATQGRQTPEVSRSFPGNFVLNRSESDQQIWARLRNSQSPDQLRAFIDRFPGSFFVEDARARITALEQIAAMQESTRRAAEESRRAADDAARQQRLAADEAARQQKLAALRAQDNRRREAEERARREQEVAVLAAAEQDRLAWQQLEQERRRAEHRRAEEQRLAEERAEEARRRSNEARRVEEARREKVERVALLEQRRLRDEEGRRRDELTRLAEAERTARDERRRQDDVRRAEDEVRAEKERVAALERQPAAFARLGTGAEDGAGRAQLAHASTAAIHAPVAAPAPGSLVREVQDRLRKLGCLQGEPEAAWGERSRLALKSFRQHASLASADAPLSPTRSVSAPEPDQATLDLLNGRQERVCPLVCPAGFRVEGESCVRRTCPRGYRINGDECLPTPRPVLRAPVTKPSIGARPRRETPAAVEAAEPRRARPSAARPGVARPAVAAGPAPVIRPRREAPAAVRIAPSPRAGPSVAARPAPAPVPRRPRVPVVAVERAAPPAPAAAASNFGPAHVGAVRAMTRF